MYLNVDMDTMKRAAIDTMEDGEPVWFGCDVGKQFQRTVGLWDADLFEYDTLYDADDNLDKAARLHYHHSAMTHAMLFTGVDVLDGRPRPWGGEDTGGRGAARWCRRLPAKLTQIVPTKGLPRSG